MKKQSKEEKVCVNEFINKLGKIKLKHVRFLYAQIRKNIIRSEMTYLFPEILSKNK